MIKIIHLISTLDRGGAETSLYRLVSNMDKYRFRNIVVSLKNVGPVGKEIQRNCISVFPLNMKKGFPDPRGIMPFSKILNEFEPHIIQTWLYHANLFGSLFKHKAKILWNIRCSNMDLKRYGTIYRWTVKLGALFSYIPHVVISNSRTGRMIHEEMGYEPARWEIIPNGFDKDIFKPNPIARKNIRKTLRIPADAFVIGCIARFDPMKDHRNLIKAASLLLKTNPAVHFILAGKGVTHDNLRLNKYHVNSCNIDQFHLLGERDDIPQILAAVDIASSTSSFGEGFPNNIGEAMSTGVPCVVTDVGDSANIVNTTGIIVPAKNSEALAYAWQSLNNAGLGVIKKMGKKARQRIEKFYNMESMIRNYEAIYQKYASNIT
tara:strand:+ start:1948 stop:3078 length:1131 start_codon:yes stop_codon:yes gene_type:complete